MQMVTLRCSTYPGGVTRRIGKMDNTARISAGSGGIVVVVSLHNGTYEVKDVLKAQGYRFEGGLPGVQTDKCWSKEIVIATREQAASLNGNVEDTLAALRQAKSALDSLIAECPIGVTDTTDPRLLALIA